MNSSKGNNFLSYLNNSALVRFLLLVACGWIIVKLLIYFEAVIVIFTFSGILAFLLNYPVEFLRKFLPRNLAVVIVFLVGIVIIGSLAITIGLALISQGQDLIDSVANFLNSLIPLVDNLEKTLQERNLQIDLSALEQILREQAIFRLTNILAIFQAFITNFATFVLIAVITFFMLIEGRKLWKLILKIVPRRRRRKFTIIVKRNFLGFFRGQLILTGFLTISTFIVFFLLQVPFPLVLSFIVGLLDTIPGIGATLGISVITSIVLSQGVWLAFKVLVVCVILQQLQDNLIAPRVMQDALNLNPIVIFIALLVGARVAGLLGIFISIPIAGILVTLFDIDEMKSKT
ncbi:AI-2E family transporter [Mastigocoleus testarum]|uniref:Permease n=1 Tax=Mastigocoleus testarum BC008 TaxID=371196 RepID=A0A0V7ZZS9_9CYAN|nr:AI-2E family transporter [Mastigocoleus testarum]KST70002.1 permease [Mastigocoleus testarum BC008]